MFKNFKINKILKKADFEFNNGNYVSALKYYNQIIYLDNKHLYSLYKKSFCLFKLEDYVNALSLLNFITDFNECVDVLFLMGRIFINQKNFKKGFYYYKKALSEDIFDYDKFRGEITYFGFEKNSFFSNQDELFQISLELCNLCLEKYDIVDIGIWKSYMLYLLNRFDEALNCINKTLISIPKCDICYLIKSNVLYGLEQYVDALKSINDALNLNPNNENFYCEKARILYKLGDFDESIKYCEKTLSIDSNCSDAYLLLSKIYNSLEEFNLAIGYINKLISSEIQNNKHLSNEGIYPFNSRMRLNDIYIMKSLILYNLGCIEESKKTMQRFLNQDDSGVKINYLKAKILFDEGKLDESLNYINKVLDLNPNCSEIILLKDNILKIHEV